METATATAPPFSNVQSAALIPNAGAGTSARINSDFNTFLKMLTAQLQNQDPLNPIDSADYAVQLATFSSVEQQTKTNQLLGDLKGQFNLLGMAQLAAWVGKEVRHEGPVLVDGSAPVVLNPLPAPSADRAVLVVQDASGAIVARQDLPLGTTPYLWQGQDPRGNALPPGTYTLSLESLRSGEVIERGKVASYALVSEVQTAAAGPVLVLRGGVVLPASEVSALRSA